MAIKKVAVHYRPRPVVGIIAPWNYPVANALMDGIGALAAGCAVLLKPSERTPLTAEVLLQRLAGLRCARGDGDGPGRPRGRPRPSSTTPTTSSSPVRARRAPRSMERAARTAHAGQPGARRQGPDDRARGRRRRPRRARRGVGRDVQRRADVCVGGAGLRARAGVRPVRRRRGARRART